MSLIKNVITKPTPSAPKGIIYGAPGVGKTTFGATNKSLIIDCENGAGAINCHRTPYLETWDEIHNWLITVENEKHDYNVIAIDTIDWLLRRIEEHVSGCVNGKTDAILGQSHGGWGNGKQVFKNYVYQILLPILDRIVNRGIAVILLAHTKRTKITDIDGVSIEKTTPELPDGYHNVMVEWSDFVCLAQIDDDNKRTLLTVETSRTMGKNRYNLPPVINFNWADFSTAIATGLKKSFNNKPNTEAE